MSEAPACEAPTSGRLDGAWHVLPVRVYFEDTDAGGIVYHANYLRFAERARTEMMRALGVPHVDMVRDGVAFAVRRCEIDFRKPARLEDALEVRTRITDIGGATLDAEQIVRRPGPDRNSPPDGADLSGEELVRLSLRLACINQNGRPVRLPMPVRAALARLPGAPGPAATAT
ncbi:MAG TPA: YbgC/FadM family acyl-CoA thioesterase [Azospirillaceae bacterium]|nr:YbgC/FadM family acyl-CoA thioesterase [Azospirillaceae bacterium]